THSATVTLKVADFSIAATPASQSVAIGNGASYTAAITALNGFGGNVSFSVSGLPTGATASFSPISVTGSGSSVLTVTTSSSTPPGTYTLTITGTRGALVHSTTVTLNVTDFSIVATPASQTVMAGNGASYTATITTLN